MASLFVRRKKSNIHEASVPVRTHALPPPPSHAPAAQTAASSSNTTPLYERFARKGNVGVQGPRSAVAISRPMTLGSSANARQEYEGRMEGRLVENRVEQRADAFYPSALQSHVQALRNEQPTGMPSMPGMRASDRPSTAPTPTRAPEPFRPNQSTHPPPIPKKSPERLSASYDRPTQIDEQITRQAREPSYNDEPARRMFSNGRALPQQKPQPTTPMPTPLSPPTSPISQRRDAMAAQVQMQQRWDSPAPGSYTSNSTPTSSFDSPRLVQRREMGRLPTPPSPPPPPPMKDRSRPTLTPPQEPVKKLSVGSGNSANSMHVQPQIQLQSPASGAASAGNIRASGSTTNLSSTLLPDSRLLSDAYAKPRQPRKYSPLAAFGLPLPGATGLSTPARSTDSGLSIANGQPEETKHENEGSGSENQSIVPNLSVERPKTEIQAQSYEMRPASVRLEPDEEGYHSPLFASSSGLSLALGNIHQNISSPQSQVAPRSPQYRRLPQPPPAPQSPPPQTPPLLQPGSPLRERSKSRTRTLSNSTSGSGKRSEASSSRLRTEQMIDMREETVQPPPTREEVDEATVTPRSQKIRADQMFNENQVSPSRYPFAQPQMPTPPTSRDGHPCMNEFGQRQLTVDVKGKGKQRADPYDGEGSVPRSGVATGTGAVRLIPGRPLIFSAAGAGTDPDGFAYTGGIQPNGYLPTASGTTQSSESMQISSNTQTSVQSQSLRSSDDETSNSLRSAASDVSASSARDGSMGGSWRLRELSPGSGSMSPASVSTPSMSDFNRSLPASSPPATSVEQSPSQPLFNFSYQTEHTRDGSPTNGWHNGNVHIQRGRASSTNGNGRDAILSSFASATSVTATAVPLTEYQPQHSQHQTLAHEQLARINTKSNSQLHHDAADPIIPASPSDMGSHRPEDTNTNGAANGNMNGTKPLRIASKRASLQRFGSPVSPISFDGVGKGSPDNTNGSANTDGMLLGSVVDLTPWARPSTAPHPTLSHSPPRKLQKLPPGMQNTLGSPIDLATGEKMAPNADPFARVDLVPVQLQQQRPWTANSLIEHQGHANIPQPPSLKTVEGLPSPVSPEGYVERRTKRRGEKLERPTLAVLETSVAKDEEETIPEAAAEESTQAEPVAENEPEAETEEAQEPEPEREPTFYPLEQHLTEPTLLAALLPYLSFRDWCVLTEVNDAMRRVIEHKRDLRETVLEYFLGTVGYVRWNWARKEPIMLTFRDLNSYMRGVSIPSHQYALSANDWLESKRHGDEDKFISVQKALLASSCRAYTRVVLRLRAQAEEEQAARLEGGQNGVYEFTPPQSSTSVNASRKDLSRTALSRPTSPTSSAGHSLFSSSTTHLAHGHNHHGHGHGRGHGSDYPPPPSSASTRRPPSAYDNRAARNFPPRASPKFRSPLFKIGHAPLLRVYVPSPEGEWLSDESVMDCEKELKRAGVLPLLRVGDVVWDAAVGDEGNVGRMIWDGNYLIDLDYTYSRTGELPQYLHTLSFPPSYFHRVIRTPGNPTVYMDLSPWAEEIAANLQLLQDRIRTETPQGGYHTVVRWIHRSKFRIKTHPYGNAPIPIPGTNLFVDPAWYGTVIVETEGTNEGLADLQDRCKGGFPPRAGANPNKQPSKVFRLLRERSRPGEIWIRAVREKERLL